MNHKTAMTDIPKPSSDITEIIEWLIGATMFCISWIYFINKYFKSKADEKQEFIQNVVVATVKATLDSELKIIKGNIDKLFEFREDDRNHTDAQFREIIKEIKK